MKRPPSPSARRSSRYRSRLDRVADGAQDLADLAAKEDQGDDRDDGDEGEDQRVLREALAVFAAEVGDQCVKEVHLRSLLNQGGMAWTRDYKRTHGRDMTR